MRVPPWSARRASGDGSVRLVALDVRGRIDRIAQRVPPLKYALSIQDRYSSLHGNVSANSITLTAFLALFAVTLLAVALVGYLDRSDVNVAKSITSWLGLSGDAGQVVTDAVRTASSSARFATIIGFVGVVTIGTSFAGAIATAYDIAWGVRNRGLVERLRGLVWLVGFGVLTAASVMATTLRTRLPTALSFLVVIVTMAVNGVLWLFTSWLLPNRKVSFRAMLPAAVAGAAMLEALKVIGGIWVPRLVSNASELWGTIGAVFALIAWILFFGRVVVYVTVIEVLEAERIGEKSPHPGLLP
jgi:membrane protein